MRYAVQHQTHYAYSDPVDVGQHMLRLTPLDFSGQTIVSRSLDIGPSPDQFVAFIDHFGNAVHYVSVESAHSQFSVRLDAVVEVARTPPNGESPAWEKVRDALRTSAAVVPPEIEEFSFPSPLVALDQGATDYVAESFRPARPMIEALTELNTRIHRDFAYTPNVTSVSTRVAEIAANRRGVCQDFSHFMIAGLRGMGLAARYVSGYVLTEPLAEGAPLQGGDASHAWISVWCGAEPGWVEFDPTNDRLVDSEHIVVAYGRDFADVTPLRGVILGGGSHRLTIGVTVARL